MTSKKAQQFLIDFVHNEDARNEIGRIAEEQGRPGAVDFRLLRLIGKLAAKDLSHKDHFEIIDISCST